MTSPTPAELGYHMPAEWAPHSATAMTWPARQHTSFPDGTHHDDVLPTFIAMLRAILSSEPLHLNCAHADDRKYIQSHLTPQQQTNLTLTDIPAYYPWCRDHGPTYVTNPATRQLAAINWDYNAWGNKYPEILHHDALINRAMTQRQGIPSFTPHLVLEGGSIEVNGTGSLLTTTQCLLNPNRNPHLSKTRIEQTLRDNLGLTNILWLDEGIAGDDTDGHIDDITRFINADTVLTVVEPNKNDPNHTPLHHNLQTLRKMKTEAGAALNIIELPMPAPLITDGQRLPASYANFYIGNTIILQPIFHDPQDDTALTIIQNAFPTRRIIPIDCRELVWGLGTFHCLTQQIPQP
jgi:agmatine deiminase